MFNDFKKVFKLKNTYKVNGIIYSLKSLPLIKKLLPPSLYASVKLKKFAYVLSIIYEVLSIFLWKAAYVLLMIILLIDSMKGEKSANFTHVFFFLTLVGSFINNQIFDPTKDKYYAIFLMKMDAKKYTLADYMYSLVKTFIGFIPVSLVFGLLIGVNVYICLLMPLLVVSVKLNASLITLYSFKKRDRYEYSAKQNIAKIIVFVVLMAAAYVLPYLDIRINEIIFISFSAISIVCAAIFAVKYVFQYTEYRRIYKCLLALYNPALNGVSNDNKEYQKLYLRKIDKGEVKSNKSGFDYFNDLFVKRHKRILTKPAKITSIIEALVLTTICVYCFFVTEEKASINNFIMTSLPYFLFIMYFANCGKGITKAMFMNCDHSMLTYSFYRQPRVILDLFKKRLVTILKINILPTLIIAVGLPILLYITGGTDNFINYIVIFVSIIAMSIFFSVHNMVLYYLLQPYNVNIEMKSATFTIVETLTYLICYGAIWVELPTLYFGISISVFCIVYVIVAMILAIKLAPKTFKLRN